MDQEKQVIKISIYNRAKRLKKKNDQDDFKQSSLLEYVIPNRTVNLNLNYCEFVSNRVKFSGIIPLCQ